MSEWKACLLKDLCDFISTKTSITNATLQNYVSTENMLPNFGGVVNADKLPSGNTINSFQRGDVLFSNIRTYFKKVWFAEFNGTVSADVLVVRAKSVCDPRFLYYLLCEPDFTEYTVLTSRGAKMPRGDKEAILSYKLDLPPLPEQKAIASVLSSLDDKIDLLHRQNKTLEAMAETLFRQWFIEEAKEDWEDKPLSSIATFTNGLACQKYPPQPNEPKLPVLKIKDLTSGISDSSDWATANVDPKYIVNHGDVIFAWSASLMVKIWFGETCVLNQHLFNVTSDEYPKWFFYQWCKYHLEEFISISQSHATTMGHIKRKDLDEAMVKVPSHSELQEMTRSFEPLMDKLITNLKQIQTLENLRDTLLPKLMSGEVRVQYQTEEVA
ncbi:restriction endonuclease subunit S [Acinetobacter baumannii]|nr:restriction endonuclease subunit S [Acinetobacter baumannii]